MRLIDADAQYDWICDMTGSARHTVISVANVLECIESAPTVDAVPVVHAYWVNGTYCSNCRAAKARPWAGYLEQNSNTFCHVCGAKMDGGVER